MEEGRGVSLGRSKGASEEANMPVLVGYVIGKLAAQWILIWIRFFRWLVRL